MLRWSKREGKSGRKRHGTDADRGPVGKRDATAAAVPGGSEAASASASASASATVRAGDGRNLGVDSSNVPPSDTAAAVAVAVAGPSDPGGRRPLAGAADSVEIRLSTLGPGHVNEENSESSSMASSSAGHDDGGGDVRKNQRLDQQHRERSGAGGDELLRVNSNGSGTASTASSTTLLSGDSLSPRSDGGTQPAAAPSRLQKDGGNDSNNDNTKLHDWEDDQTISRLESECSKLSYAKTKLRKYTQEWFFLDSRLANAREELEAAMEDRDLHVYLGAPGGEPPGGEDSGSAAEAGGIVARNTGSAVDASEGNGGVGIGVPETVFLAGSEEKRPASLTVSMGGSAILKPKLDGSIFTFEEPSAGKGGSNRPSSNGGGVPQTDRGKDELEAIRIEHERVERELERVPKFSPKWFALKEDLVELSIALDEGAYGEAPLLLHDKPKEIVVASKPPGGGNASSNVPAVSDKKESAKDRGRRHSKRGPKQEGGTPEKEKKKDQNHHPASPFRFRHASPCSPSPITPRSSLSPYPTSSESGGNASNCLSPYHSVSNGSRTSSAGASHDYRRLLLGGGHSSDDDDEDVSPEGEKDTGDGQGEGDDGPSRDLDDLRAQHSEVSEDLRRLPQYSMEWFDIKTRRLQLEDRIAELEVAAANDGVVSQDGSSRSSSASSHTRNHSFTSGWTSVWSESEGEIMSYADDLELGMIAEVLERRQEEDEREALASPPKALLSRHHFLKQGPYQEEKLARCNKEVHKLEQVQFDQERFANSVVKIQAWVRGNLCFCKYNRHRENAIIIQCWLRREHAKSMFRHAVNSVMTTQDVCQRRQHQRERQESEIDVVEQQKPQIDDPSKVLDAMMHEFLLLGAEEELLDEFEKENYHAVMIQEWWRHYTACMPAVLLRRHALAYHCLVRDQEKVEQKQPGDRHQKLLYSICRKVVSVRDRKQHQLQQQPNHHSKWQLFSAVAIQGSWRGYCARKRLLQIYSVVLTQGLWRGYCARKSYHHARLCALIIQSVARGRLQRRQYAQLRETSIAIQSFFRKGCAYLKFKRALSSVVIIQCAWRTKLSYRVVAAAKQLQEPKKTGFDHIFDEMETMLDNEGDDEFERQSYYAVLIQEQWRNHRACRPLMAMRRRVVQYQAIAQQHKEQEQHKFASFAALLIQAHWRQRRHRRAFQLSKSSAVKIQSVVRSNRQSRRYNRRLEQVTVIQSFVRKHWVATGQLYTDKREVIFHSTAMGIRLQHGKDGFVRVLSVLEAEATDGSPSIERDGTITPGDLVIEAAGVALSSPITKDQWGLTVKEIRNALRPMKLVVACGTRRTKLQLLDECAFVWKQLLSLISVVRIQRVWRKHDTEKIKRSECLQASIVIQSYMRQWLARSLYERELKIAMLLTECEHVLAQLKSLQASTVMQSHARQWLARSSFIRERDSCICIQSLVRMKLQVWRYMQTMTSVALIQGFARRWLAQMNTRGVVRAESPTMERLEQHVLSLTMQLGQMQEFTPEWTDTSERLHAMQDFLRKAREIESHRDSPSTQRLEEKVLALAVRLSQMQECNPEWMDLSDKLNSLQEELRHARELESLHEIEHSRRNDQLKENISVREESPVTPCEGESIASGEPAVNVRLLREKLERRNSAPVFPKNASTSSSKASTPNQSRPNSQAQSPTMPEARDELGHASSVARLRQSLEATASTPFFPHNQVKSTRDIIAVPPQTRPVPEAHSGEVCSPEDELGNINSVAKYEGKLLEIDNAGAESVRSMTPAESSRSSISSTSKKNGFRKKKKLTPEQKMKNLGFECISLSQRMKSLPKFSPEWTLTKIEMKMVTDELEFLYAEFKGVRV